MFIEEHTNGVRKEEIPHAGWIVLEYGYENRVFRRMTAALWMFY